MSITSDWVPVGAEAKSLNIPLFGNDTQGAFWGTKTGNRQVFLVAGLQGGSGRSSDQHKMGVLPSGKHAKSYWKWPFISFYIHVVRWFTHVAEGEVSIKAVEHGHVYPFIYSWFSQNEWIFHTFLYVCQRVPHLFLDVTPIVYGLLYGSYTTDGQANWLLYEPLDVYQVVFFPCVDVLWVSL